MVPGRARAHGSGKGHSRMLQLIAPTRGQEETIEPASRNGRCAEPDSEGGKARTQPTSRPQGA
eukprot:5866083-Alexandrium_andersonii.AAC.1